MCKRRDINLRASETALFQKFSHVWGFKGFAAHEDFGFSFPFRQNIVGKHFADITTQCRLAQRKKIMYVA